MEKIIECTLCGSCKMSHFELGSRILLTGKEYYNEAHNTFDTPQEYVTDAFRCDECGHIDFFVIKAEEG